jgi:hypothetical protein
MSATPIEFPTCCAVFSVPAAAPAVSGSRSERTIVIKGVINSPIPAPMRIRAGARRPTAPVVPTSATVARRTACPAARVRPPVATTRRPWRAVSEGAAIDVTRYEAAMIVNTRPAPRAVRPRPCWR